MGCGPSLRTRRVSSMQTLHLGRAETPPRVKPRGAQKKGTRRLRRERSLKMKLPPGYVILFAVDSYTSMLHLKGAVQDAEALGKSLMNLGFEILVKLYNESATVNKIQKNLREICRKLPTRARVVIFFAGHGLRHEETGRTFYCTHNTQQDSLLTTAFDLEYIFTLTDFMPFQQLWIFDFCFSGGGCSSVVRRGQWELNCQEAPSISIMAAGRSGEQVVESRLLDTPLSSPMITPEVSPDSSPAPSPVHAAQGQGQGHFTEKPIPVPKMRRGEGRTKGLFTNCLVRALAKIHTSQRHRGVIKGKQSLAQMFVNIRGDVHQRGRLLGATQMPQLNTVQWYRNKRTDGVFFF